MKEDENNNPAAGVARQFMDIWQKQISMMMTDPEMINASLKIMHDFQKTMTTNKQKTARTTNDTSQNQTVDANAKPSAAASQSYELLLAQFALSLQEFERRLSKIESQFASEGIKPAGSSAKRTGRKVRR